MIYDQYKTKDMGISDHQQHIQLTYKKKKKKIGQHIHLFLYMVNCKLHWMQHDIVHFLIYMDELALCI